MIPVTSNRITLGELLGKIDEPWHASLCLVCDICHNFPGHVFRQINKRKSNTIPTVFLEFADSGIQIMRFDLRRSKGFQVFFEYPTRIPEECRNKYPMIPHTGTGWVGLTANATDAEELEEQISYMLEYWNTCVQGIECGEITQHLKSQSEITVLARDAYDEFPVCDKKSIKSMPVRPDIHFIQRKLIIEVDGAQHYKYIPFFHRNAGRFKGQQERDKKLNDWCRENGVALLHIVENATSLIASVERFRSICEETLSRGGVSYLVAESDNSRMLSEKEFYVWYDSHQ